MSTDVIGEVTAMDLECQFDVTAFDVACTKEARFNWPSFYKLS